MLLSVGRVLSVGQVVETSKGAERMGRFYGTHVE
jgi:hypothetical protein